MNSNSLSRRSFLQNTSAAAVLASAAPLSLMAADGAAQLTLAFVGCAHIHTPSFVNLLKSRKDVRVKAVWDHDSARAEKRAKELDTQTVSNLKEIWNDPEIKAVVICSETNRHLELILAAAKAKKHIFAEKPLGFGAKDSFAMASAILNSRLLFTTGYFMRTDPKHLFLKEEIAKGTFGKITRIRGSNCHSGSLGGWFDTEWRWMADPKIAGVGAFGDLGTHSLDIMMWLLGDVESISADIKVVNGRYGECDESGEAIMRFNNGITGTLAAGWVDVDDPMTLLISGTEAHATIFKGELYFKANKVEGADGNKPWKKLPAAPALPLHMFCDAVLGKGNPQLVSPREAAARVSVMEAAYKADKSRKWEKPVYPLY